MIGAYDNQHTAAAAHSPRSSDSDIACRFGWRPFSEERS